jgi:hypothetical protein
MSHRHPVLLIEDNPMDLELTMRALRHRHLTNPIDVARDGQEAIDRIARWEAGEPVPVVVLLDLKLPKVDGFDVLRAYKRHELLRAVPVVVLTTSEQHGDVRTAYELGANSYIVKPVDFDKFLEVAAQVELYWTVLNRPAG